ISYRDGNARFDPYADDIHEPTAKECEALAIFSAALPSEPQVIRVTDGDFTLLYAYPGSEDGERTVEYGFHHDLERALPLPTPPPTQEQKAAVRVGLQRSAEHTSELQSH